MKSEKYLDQQISRAVAITLGEHLAEWCEQGERLLLTDPSGREQVQLSHEEAYLLFSLLLAHFQKEGEV